jgi:hypothetical protein
MGKRRILRHDSLILVVVLFALGRVGSSQARRDYRSRWRADTLTCVSRIRHQSHYLVIRLATQRSRFSVGSLKEVGMLPMEHLIDS